MGRSRKSGAERAKEFRKKLKANAERYNTYKANDKERKGPARNKSANVLTPDEAARKNKLNRDRVRKCRLLKKQGKSGSKPDQL